MNILVEGMPGGKYTMIDLVRASLDYLGQHPHLAVLAAFIVAMAEALPIIGLFTPSTVVLVGLGGLAGLGKLPFWPIFAATTAGAIVGDAISYWIGRIYRDRLAAIWPFTRYPTLFEAGKHYTMQHGGKSIIFGRFIPGIKAVVPSIAGMMGMGIVRFSALNFVSALAWTAVHILPGLSAGAALSITGAISKRLAIALAVIAVVTLFVIWLARFSAHIGLRYLPHLQAAMVRWATTRRGAIGPAILRLVSPDHADFRLLFILLAIFASAIIGIAGLLENVVTGDALVQFDSSVSQFLQSLRTNWGDSAMIGITMLGDTPVTLGVAIITAGVLVLRHRRHLALGLIIVLISAAAFVAGLKQIVHAARPSDMFSGFDAFSFPSGHATMAATLYGALCLVALRGLPARYGRVFAGLLVFIIALIAFSRIYLAAHWPSDVAAGVLFGAAATAGLAAVFRRYEIPRRTAGSTIGAAAAAFLLIGTWHLEHGFAQAQQTYSRPPLPVVALLEPWRQGGWRDLPSRRIDLAGETEELLVLQWQGEPSALMVALAQLGWTTSPRWSVRNLNAFAAPDGAPASLPVLPSLHNGRRPDIMAILTDHTGTGDGRYVLRGWTERVSAVDSGVSSVLVASIIREQLHHPLGFLSIPVSSEDSACESRILLAELPGAAAVGQVQPAQDGACGGPVILSGPAQP